MVISTTPEKLQQTTDEIGDEPETQSIPFIYIEGVKVKLRNVVITQNLSEGSNSFLLGHSTNGILGTATALGGSQIVLGATTDPVTIELVRRSYEWKAEGDFKRGIKTNVDITQGFLQLGNVTVRNILLEHKTK